ncbi:MAG: hypothetical protein KC621_13440 [Myxococcales bacterium]|nr:hypothetical protein [Myxococcales bacterium]
MSRTSVLLLPVLLAGCATEVAELDLDASPDAVWQDARVGGTIAPTMTLTGGVLNPGASAIFEVGGAQPGDTVHLLYGQGGVGACSQLLGGGCLSIANPAVVGQAVADVNGDAIFVATVPANAPVGARPLFQAAVPDGAQSRVSDVWQGEILALDVDDFLVNVVDGQITRKKPGTQTDWDWDPLGIVDKPDVYYVAWVGNQRVYTSNMASDDLTPAFNDVFAVTVLAGQQLDLDFYDSDSALGLGDDFVGTVSFTHEELNDARGLGPVTYADRGLVGMDIAIDEQP